MLRGLARQSLRAARSVDVAMGSATRAAGPGARGAQWPRATGAREMHFFWEEKDDDRIIPSLGRTGLLAMKCGMTHDWDAWGTRVPLTVLQVGDCEVVRVLTPEVEGYSALQLGIGPVKEKNVTKPLKGHFAKTSVTPKRHLFEFRCSPENFLEPGTKMSALHFVPGQYVDVTSKSAGKGFAGVMKRWGFKGQPASHGVSKAHRSLGSTGQHTDPGRVFKGKKMPGRMGAVQRTVQSQLVYKVDPERGLIFIKGHVPGKRGTIVRVKDSIKAKVRRHLARRIPLPTWDPLQEAPTGKDLVAPPPEKDPYLAPA